MTIDIVIANLDAFVSEDDDNVGRLDELLAPLADFPPAARFSAVRSMFSVIERSPDADLGAPGPLVSALEQIPGYADLLIESLQRQPQDLTVWMVNRILNAELAAVQRQKWLSILADVLANPHASESTKEEVSDFLAFQAARADD